MLYLSSLCFFTVIAHAHALQDTVSHHIATLLTCFSILNHAKFYDKAYPGKTLIRRGDQLFASAAWFRSLLTCVQAYSIFLAEDSAGFNVVTAEWILSCAALYYSIWVYHIGKKVDDRVRGAHYWHLSLHAAMIAKSHMLLDLKSRLGLLGESCR